MAGDCKYSVMIAVAVCTIFLSSLEVNAHDQHCIRTAYRSEAYTAYYRRSSDYYTRCGLFDWDRCRRTRYHTQAYTAYRSRSYTTCCSGYGPSLPCHDVNECTRGTDRCHSRATCHNTQGSHTCSCNTGYTGSGFYCADVDECARGTDSCHDNATCHNTQGSYVCYCNTGYVGNGSSCLDVNECTSGTHRCHSHATCINNQGSYTCFCNTGYTGDGYSCINVDECALGNHNCHDDATCYNTEGSYTCSCNTGYTGNGSFCTPLLPSGPTITTAFSQSPTSITLIWTQPAGEVVDSFEIVVSYLGPCTGLTHTSTCNILYGTARQHTLRDLQEFSNYTVTIRAENVVGRGEKCSTSVVTMADVPGDPPMEVTAFATNPVSIIIEWGRVPCINRKSNITGYMVRYSTGGGSTVDVSVSGTGQSDRTYTATLLAPNASYSIQVAAVTSTGITGPFSAAITEEMLPPKNEGDVRFSLNDKTYQNNSLVNLEDIGEDDDALLCITNLTACCQCPYTGEMGTDMGNWFFPNGTRIYTPGEGTDWDFYRTRGKMVVVMQRRGGGEDGIYRCDIPDVMNVTQTIYIGVYSASSGSPSGISLTFDPKSNTLACTSTGGPATAVTWRRDGVVITPNATHQQTKSLVYPDKGTYQTVLTIDPSVGQQSIVGTYNCTVENVRGKSSKALVVTSETLV